MTKDELILISAYTGFLLAPDFGEVHEACEKALGRPIFAHELASNEVNEAIREALLPKIKQMVDEAFPAGNMEGEEADDVQ